MLSNPSYQTFHNRASLGMLNQKAMKWALIEGLGGMQSSTNRKGYAESRLRLWWKEAPVPLGVSCVQVQPKMKPQIHIQIQNDDILLVSFRIMGTINILNSLKGIVKEHEINNIPSMFLPEDLSSNFQSRKENLHSFGTLGASINILLYGVHRADLPRSRKLSPITFSAGNSYSCVRSAIVTKIFTKCVFKFTTIQDTCISYCTLRQCHNARWRTILTLNNWL